MDKNKQRTNIKSGLAWTFYERISAQLISTVVSIILARMLMPEEYGTIAIVMVFISLCDVFVVSGFSSALVQKKDTDETDYHTAFILSLSLSIVLYIIMFAIAPWISRLYGTPMLSAPLRVLGFRLIITAYNTIQQAHIRRRMEFKRFFFVTIWGTIISGIFGILAAYCGLGVWALVIQNMVNSLATTVLTYFVCAWKPRLVFSKKKAKEIYAFGWRVLCTRLVSTLQNDLRSLIVGKAFGSAELAYFDHGKKYPSLFMNNVNEALNKVLLPVFSRLQDDMPTLKETLRKTIRIGVYIVAPLLFGLCAVAETFVAVVLTEKWLKVVPILQIFCFLWLTRPFEEMCHQAVIAVGRTDISLKIIIAINITAIFMVLIAVFVFESVVYMALLTVGNTLVSVIGFAWAARKLFGYRYKEQLQDVFPSIIIALLMGAIVLIMNRLPINTAMRLILQVITGACTYVVLSAACKLDSYVYMKKLVNTYLRKK